MLRAKSTTAPAQDALGILEGYVTERELARQLDKSLRTVRRWRGKREGPPSTRIGDATSPPNIAAPQRP
jgi:hypothetical protein